VKVTFESGKKKTKFALGNGQFGKLRVARKTETNEFIGVKKVKGDDKIEASLNEGRIQAKLSYYPHIMPLLDSVDSRGSRDERVLYQFMPLAGFGNGVFFQEKLALLKDQTQREELLIYIAKGLLTGVANMHKKGISHLDIKPHNFVIDRTGTPWIIDFGCAMELGNSDQLTGGIGDTRYYSPERLAHHRYMWQQVGEEFKVNEAEKSFSGPAADAWAMGVTLLEIAYNQYPFEQIKQEERLGCWDSSYFKMMISKIKELKDVNSVSFKGLIKGLLTIDVKERLKAIEALDWPVFKRATPMPAEKVAPIFKQLSELSVSQIDGGSQSDNIDGNNSSSITQINYVEIKPKEKDEHYACQDFL